MADAALESALPRVNQSAWMRGLTATAPWSVPALAAALLRMVNGPLTVDDAYITFRYARNLVEGHGFVYNPGEAVLGTTTPLWGLLLAAVHALFRSPLPETAMLLNAGFDAASAVVLFALVRRMGGSAATGAMAALLFAAAPMSVAYAAGGMEASLFVMLLGLVGLSAATGRPMLAAGLSAIATLTRPEGVLAGGLVLAQRTWQTRRLPFREAAVYAGLLLPWAVYATVTYGGPLPQTMAAKAAAYVVEPLGNTLALALQPGLPGLSLFTLTALPVPAPAVAVAALGVAACLVVFGLRLSLRFALSMPLALFPVAYVAAYALAGLRGVRMFHWYVVPLVPFYCVGLVLAAERLSQSNASRPARWLPYVALAVWWLPGFAVLSQHPAYPLGFSLEREQLYRQVALDYASNWTEQTVVAAPEIGALGYYSRASILDTVGLVSPQAARIGPPPADMLASDNAIAPALIRAERPEYVVSLDQFIRLSLLKDAWFQQAYYVVERRPARIWASEELLVFRRGPDAETGG